jgi:hypothetical protein
MHKTRMHKLGRTHIRCVYTVLANPNHHPCKLCVGCRLEIVNDRMSQGILIHFLHDLELYEPETRCSDLVRSCNDVLEWG